MRADDLQISMMEGGKDDGERVTGGDRIELKRAR